MKSLLRAAVIAAGLAEWAVAAGIIEAVHQLRDIVQNASTTNSGN